MAADGSPVSSLLVMDCTTCMSGTFSSFSRNIGDSSWWWSDRSKRIYGSVIPYVCSDIWSRAQQINGELENGKWAKPSHISDSTRVTLASSIPTTDHPIQNQEAIQSHAGKGRTQINRPSSPAVQDRPHSCQYRRLNMGDSINRKHKHPPIYAPDFGVSFGSILQTSS